MRVVQVMLAKKFGGAERYFIDLCNHLANSGYHVLAITHSNFGFQEEFSGNDNLKVKNVNVLGKWDFFAIIKLYFLIKKYDAEIVETHLARASLLCGWACKFLSLPLVAKAHNYIKLKHYKHVDVFMSMTSHQEEYLKQIGISEKRIFRVPNFSSLKPEDDISCLSNNRPIKFYALGRFVKKKGFDILIQAFDKLIKAGVDAKLLIGGSGPEKESLENLIKKLNLTTHIKFTGWEADIVSFSKDKDVFVLPSIDEPFGIVVLEAMALGKPIIATTTQGPREVLNENTAYLVSPGSSDELFVAMKKLAEDKGYCQVIATNSLKLFKERYTSDVVVPQIEALYKSLIP